MFLEFLEGIIKIGIIILSVFAGMIGLNLLKDQTGQKDNLSWKILIVVVFLFIIQEFLGTLRAFGIWENPYITHIVPTFMLIMLIIALNLEIIRNKYILKK